MKPLDELTTRCIRCGFCLESCPTYRLTGEETESPRGRIYLVRSADEGLLDWDAVWPHLDRCLGCRACETACPSGVEYGQILEIARDRLETTRPHRARKALLRGLSSPRSMRFQMALGKMLPGRKIPNALSRILSGQAAAADKPTGQAAGTLPSLDEASLPAIRGEVYLLEGCVMRVLYPRVHEATRRLLRRVGFSVRDVEQGCCGSLHLHTGYVSEARGRGDSLTQVFGEDLQVIVNSAGCGSTMKGYADLLGTSAEGFAKRVFDASEFLLAKGLADLVKDSSGLDLTATYHDACHLAHGQGIRSQPRELLRSIPRINLVELGDSDTCCGSAGIYNLTQPQLARQLLDRKWRNIESTGASVVAMGNPGCHAWIGQAAQEHGRRINVLHTMELLEASFIGAKHFE